MCPYGFPEEILPENIEIIDIFEKGVVLGMDFALELLRPRPDFEKNIDKLFILKSRFEYLKAEWQKINYGKT